MIDYAVRSRHNAALRTNACIRDTDTSIDERAVAHCDPAPVVCSDAAIPHPALLVGEDGIASTVRDIEILQDSYTAQMDAITSVVVDSAVADSSVRQASNT